MKLTNPLGWPLVIIIYFSTVALFAGERRLISWQTTEYGWQGLLTHGEIRLTVLLPSAMEVNLLASGHAEIPRTGILAPTWPVPFTMEERPDCLRLAAGQITAILHRTPFRIEWYGPQGRLWKEERGYFRCQQESGFRFRLTAQEKLLGGGERVLGMDRRGRRLAMYNKPSYGYENQAESMY